MFYTPRLRLRAVEPEDLEQAWEWVNDPEVHQFITTTWPLSHQDEVEWLERQRRLPLWQRPLSLEARTDEGWRLIGNAALVRIEWPHRWAELAIMLGDKAFWGQGYGTEAVQALTGIAFDILNLHRVQLEVYEYNARARRAYEKAGFRLEGRRREAIFYRGAYHDSLLMAVLRAEWTPPEWWRTWPYPGAAAGHGITERPATPR
ncbi:MAG: GNAT family N-acetyltransferase [Chloroflexi bacterium]|nr:GNAT family N-acetyltransferase [Chloroflexota bacterium]